MAQFKYAGKNRKGKIVRGRVTSATKREAITSLRQKGIAVTNIEEIKPTGLNKEITIGKPVKLQDFVIYLRQFSTLLRAGVSIVDATNILAAQTNSKALRKALTEVEMDLREGHPFSESAAKHKKIFPPIFVNMIAAGEASGSIDDALDRLAVHFEKQYETRQKVVSALSYPVIVGIIAVLVVIFLLTNVVPTFANMLSELGGELPLVTQLVLEASDFMQKFWWLIIGVMILFFAAISLIKKNPKSKYYYDLVILRMPIFGKLMQKAVLARMSRTLSSLFSSSVPILQALAIVEKVVENEVIARVLRKSRHSLESGQPLTEPMRKHWVFPPLVIHMIAIGEQTGSLDKMLSKVADFYEMEVDNMTDRLKSFIEPVMIVFLASMVGIIIMAIMVPMFEIYSQIQ